MAKAGSGSGGGGNGFLRSSYSPGSRCYYGGNGGSGVIAVRYQIGTIAPVAKASGGVISLYNDKYIHTFTSSGTFTAPPTFNETVEYVVVGGGGAAGGGLGGGGGAGGYRTGTTPITGPGTTTVVIGAGGYANDYYPGGNSGNIPALDGSSSYFGTPLTCKGGGAGAGYNGAGSDLSLIHI